MKLNIPCKEKRKKKRTGRGEEGGEVEGGAEMGSGGSTGTLGKRALGKINIP